MKSKRNILVILTLLVAVFVAGWRLGGQSPSRSEKKPIYYQHPMRPEIHSPVAAKDEMGMDYIPVYEDKAAKLESPMPGRGMVSLSPEATRLIGVRTSAVTTQALSRKVQTYGTVAFDPSLYNALAEYREAVRARDEISESPITEVKKQAQSLVDAARLKLKLLGIAPSQIQNEKGLLINERGRGVWVYAELYEQDIPVIRSGIHAVITTPALPGQTFQGKVRSIDPTINPVTRTSRARIELQTVNENLRPEMLVDVSLEVPLGKRLSLPTTAVFDTGREQYVYVEIADHSFIPKPIKMGLKLADFTEVLEGVQDGDRVVTQANFLIDSESRFQAPSSATMEASPQHGGEHP